MSLYLDLDPYIYLYLGTRDCHLQGIVWVMETVGDGDLQLLHNKYFLLCVQLVASSFR